MPKRKFGLFRGLLVTIVSAIVLLAIAIGGFAYWAQSPVKLMSPEIELTISPGAHFGQVVTALRKAGVLVDEMPFKLLARQQGAGGKIRAGVYLVKAPISAAELLGKLTRGEVVQVEIVIPEGWTYRQLRSRLDAHSGLRHDTQGLADREILRQIGASETDPEGIFFPDTYRVDKGASDLTILRAAYQAMAGTLAEAWKIRDPDLPISSPREALILASIVEKESGRPEDRPMIASVFHNRLRIGMKLQTDPTVIYGLGMSFDGNLRKRDLITDTPYNTYTRAGLPPGPISLPGKDAIIATVRPPASRMLYFVARGDGSSEFSPSLDAHNRAVSRFQRGGR
jgi:UPF0755 protein